jgi:actin-like ATPase involved in cell morphogenesis
MSERWVLAIDFGTSFTSAAMVSDGRVEVLEIDGVRRLPSVVLWLDDELVVGAAAESQRVLHPQAAERNPKRYLGVRKNLLLGGQPVPVVDAVGAVLHAVYDEALRRSGGTPPAEVRLTHPARWPAERLDALRTAAAEVGIPSVALLAEPVAAAMHYGGNKIAAGEYVAVYDLGGGTFDTAVLRRVEHGFELAGPPGGDDRLGGEDFDHRLMDFVIARLAVTEPDAATALRESEDIQWKKAASQVLVEARLAKEALSRQTSYTMLLPPPINQEMRITRPEFEALIRADVQRTIEEFGATVEAADLEPDQLSARYLAGGSSRIPLVSRLLQEAYDAAPDTYDDPKVAVALGAAQAADPGAMRTVIGTAGDGNGNGAAPIVTSDGDAEIDEPSPLDATGVDVLAGAALASAPVVANDVDENVLDDTTLDDTTELPPPPDGFDSMPSSPPVVPPVAASAATVLTEADAPTIAEPVEKRKSDPKTRRLAFLAGAGLLVLAAVTLVLISRGGSPEPPKPTATLAFASEDLGFAKLDRTWTVTDGQLDGTLTFVPAGEGEGTGRHNEAFPKSMVADASQIDSDPDPTEIVRADPILGWDVTVPAGGSTTITYEVDVPDETTEDDLRRWQNEAKAEIDGFNTELTKKPTLVLTEPTDGDEVGQPELMFRGSTDADAKIDINGTPIPVNADGTWEHLSTGMAEGPNAYTITATGANLQTTSTTRTVSYKAPAQEIALPPPTTTGGGGGGGGGGVVDTTSTTTTTQGQRVTKPTAQIHGATSGSVACGYSCPISMGATWSDNATYGYWRLETVDRQYIQSQNNPEYLYCIAYGSWTHYFVVGNSAGENVYSHTVTCY